MKEITKTPCLHSLPISNSWYWLKFVINKKEIYVALQRIQSCIESCVKNYFFLCICIQINCTDYKSNNNRSTITYYSRVNYFFDIFPFFFGFYDYFLLILLLRFFGSSHMEYFTHWSHIRAFFIVQRANLKAKKLFYVIRNTTENYEMYISFL